jgi:tRNA(Ile2) C34 agmatinyltransferase TiaS
MTIVDGFVQPHCPDCGVVMRDDPHGFRCPSCSRLDDHSAEHAAVEIPPAFDGPDLDQHRHHNKLS